MLAFDTNLLQGASLNNFIKKIFPVVGFSFFKVYAVVTMGNVGRTQFCNFQLFQNRYKCSDIRVIEYIKQSRLYIECLKLLVSK